MNCCILLEIKQRGCETRRKRRLGIIADDLTGANDAGSLFVKAGSCVYVGIGEADVFDLAQRSVVPVLDTESRLDPPDKAFSKVLKAAEAMRSWRADIVLKKIDTALRGPVGAEIDAAMKGLGESVCFVIPAIPEMDRITVGGRQLIQGMPLEDTCFADDPFTPTNGSDIMSLLAQQTKRKVAHIDLAAVRQGRVETRIEQLVQAGAEIVLVDAAAQNDIFTAVRAIIDCGMAGLLIGSLGLAEALAQLFLLEREKVDTSNLQSTREGRILGVVGSFHENTLRQVRQAELSDGLEVVRLRSGSFLADHLHAVEEAGNRIASAFKTSKDVLLVMASTRNEVDECLSEGRQKGLRSLEVRSIITRALGDIVSRAVKNGPIQGLFLCGGDTAYEVCRSLSARALFLGGATAPGVVMCALIGGPHDGLPVITKGGSVGDDDSILSALDYLRSTQNCFVIDRGTG
ncbi:MAG: four-carbon acid sugar kinase family protein [Armatimonadetes bacterium]|nr:four-carbon acid sugar kinase family protein [Armatimonadota bacterium]